VYLQRYNYPELWAKKNNKAETSARPHTQEAITIFTYQIDSHKKKKSPFDRIALKLGNRKLEPDRTRRRPLLPKATLKARLPTAAHENRLPRLVPRLHGTSRRAGVASLRRAWSRWCGARSETNWRLGSSTGRPESSAGRRDGVIAA
jgi:hypothetical protein